VIVMSNDEDGAVCARACARARARDASVCAVPLCACVRACARA